MTQLRYAGIGSRDTPHAICDVMYDTAYKLALKCWLLRSGRARHADQAFEFGVYKAMDETTFIGNPVEIWVRRDSARHPEWFAHAAQFHPAWDRCSDYAKALHARNSPIILGENLDTPVDRVICWTEHGQEIGGTAQGLRIARHHGIPIINLGDADGVDRLREWLATL